MEGSFCIFGFSPNGKVWEHINPNFAKPRDVSGNAKQNSSEMKFSRNKIIVIILCIIVLIGLWIVNFGNGISEYYSTSWVSMSIKESKKTGAFVREVNIGPKKIKYDRLSVVFNECWIEKQTQLKYSWLFYKEYQATGKYRLCFNLKRSNSNAVFFPYFFIDDQGKSFALNGSGNEEVFNTFINKNIKGKIKISLVKSWKEPRTENIVINL